jgi:ankyrin repeat protein
MDEMQELGAAEPKFTGGSLAQRALAGDSQGLRALLKAGADPNERGEGGRSALMAALASQDERDNRWTCANLLIKAGADVDARNDQGDTALMWAVDRGARDCVKLLMEAGADLDLKNGAGMSAARIAAQKGRFDSLLSLAGAGAALDFPVKPLLSAWAEGESLARFLALMEKAMLSSMAAQGDPKGAPSPQSARQSKARSRL